MVPRALIIHCLQTWINRQTSLGLDRLQIVPQRKKEAFPSGLKWAKYACGALEHYGRGEYTHAAQVFDVHITEVR